MKGLTKVLSVILVLLIVAAIAGVITYFALQAVGVTFYVELNGVRYYSGASDAELWLPGGEQYSFTVKTIEGEDTEYSAEIRANQETTFTFTADQNPYNFYRRDDASMNDYTDVFDLQKGESGFTIDMPQDVSLQQVMKERYAAEVVIPDGLEERANYFVLIVTVGGNAVNLPFSFAPPTLELDQPGIVF